MAENLAMISSTSCLLLYFTANTTLKTEMKTLDLPQILASLLISFTSGIAFINPLFANNVAMENSELDVPLCYMQTPDGKTVDLVNMCGQKNNDANSPTVCNTNSNNAKVSIANYNYDGNLLRGNVINSTCKTVKYIKVNYEVLDQSGNLIDNGFIYAQPVNVEPGQSASFRGAVASGAKVQATHLDWQD
jgi:ABC-type ATPase with predicted acetyltransferase domain